MRRSKPREPFRTIVADPPWPYADKLPGAKRGAEKHYSTLPMNRIESFLRDRGFPIADDALLFLWRVAPMQSEALGVMREWRFQQKSEIVWCKSVRDDEEQIARVAKSFDNKGPRVEAVIEASFEAARRLKFGMGHYVRNGHEVCLIGRRGRAKVLHRSQRSVFFAPVGEHSEKPDEFYRIVEELAPGPYLDLFARKERRGWTSIGDEISTPPIFTHTPEELGWVKAPGG